MGVLNLLLRVSLIKAPLSCVCNCMSIEVMGGASMWFIIWCLWSLMLQEGIISKLKEYDAYIGELEGLRRRRVVDWPLDCHTEC